MLSFSLQISSVILEITHGSWVINIFTLGKKCFAHIFWEMKEYNFQPHQLVDIMLRVSDCINNPQQKIIVRKKENGLYLLIIST